MQVSNQMHKKCIEKKNLNKILSNVFQAQQKIQFLWDHHNLINCTNYAMELNSIYLSILHPVEMLVSFHRMKLKLALINIQIGNLFF